MKTESTSLGFCIECGSSIDPPNLRCIGGCYVTGAQIAKAYKRHNRHGRCNWCEIEVLGRADDCPEPKGD